MRGDVLASSMLLVLRDLDLDVAEIPLPGSAFALLLARVVGLGGPRWTTLESTVPIVGDEGFALVALRRPMRVNVVDVRKIGMKSEEGAGRQKASK